MHNCVIVVFFLPGRDVDVHGAPDTGIDQLTSSTLPQISTTDPSASRPGAISQVTYYLLYDIDA